MQYTTQDMDEILNARSSSTSLITFIINANTDH